MTNTQHKQWLLETLNLAKKREGFCAPNPAVGAVVVKNNQLISVGYHYGAGHPHAEVGALDDAGEKARGADLYVSLEPCCHYGRTPPCTEKIKAAGIARVFFAFLDPNPIVAGKGQAVLRDSGIACEHISLNEINDFYRAYSYWTTHKKPLVTAKIAITADGYVANADGSPLAITGEQCRVFTHENRLRSDAILSTTQTIIADDPQMNVRFGDDVFKKPLYLLDSSARLPLTAKIFDTTTSITIFHGENVDKQKLKALTEKGVRCIAVALKKDGVDLNAVMYHIGQDGVHSLWVEAGPTCFNALVNQDLLHRAVIYQSNFALEKLGFSVCVDINSLKNKAFFEKDQAFQTDKIYLFDF